MLFTTLILISVDGEHNGLKKCIDFGHIHQATEMRNVPRLGLEQEEEVTIFLCLFIVREETLLDIGGLIQMVGHFVLLSAVSQVPNVEVDQPYLLQCHAILNEQRYS